MAWLPDGEKKFDELAVSTQYRRVTDGQTNGHTARDSIVRAMHTHCAVKSELVLLTRLIP